MARLDVSELMTDPDFVDFVRVRRTSQHISTGGIANRQVEEVTPPLVIGSWQPASSTDVQRLPEEQRTTGLYAFYTSGDIRDASDANDADEIFWKGAWYTVIQIDDWSHFGNGYKRCIARQKPLNVVTYEEPF